MGTKLRQAATALTLLAGVQLLLAGTSAAYDRNWTGLYLGAGVGYGTFVAHNENFGFPPSPTPLIPPEDVGGKGGLGTIIAGYDVKLAPAMVVGVFVDFDWTNANGDWRDRRTGQNIGGNLRQDRAWAVGGRLGFLTNPGTLLYVSGGWTQAKFDQLDLTDFGAATPDRFIPAMTFNGWFAGAGIETQLAHNWSLRLEYRFSDFGEEDYTRFFTATGTSGPVSTTGTVDLTTQSARLDLTYKFNWDRAAGPLK
jgi:outer membrane immunogenic protein